MDAPTNVSIASSRSIVDTLFCNGIIPVVKIEHAELAVSLGRALMQGGLGVVEITFRTQAAEQAIRNLTTTLPELLVGAGTVLTVDQVKKAVGAGAKFIVSPGFNPKTVSYCKDNGIPIVPGANSPSQVEMGLEQGLSVLKFFPAEESGGIKYLKAMSAPFDGVKFIPTGGINQENLSAYLALPNVLACGGTWMVKPEMISAGKFDEIATITREAIRIMLGYEFAHLGINNEGDDQAGQGAELLSRSFYFKCNEGTGSIFAGQNAKEIELLKKMYLGKNGHIAVATNSIPRALFYLKKAGIGELADTRNEKNGKIKAVYLDKELAGFALHLLQK